MTQSTSFEPAPRPGHSVRLLAGVGVLLAVGLLIGLATEAAPESFADPGVEFIELDSKVAGSPNAVVAGPGGFVRARAEGFEFSPDGESWTTIKLRKRNKTLLVDTSKLTVKATDELWMIERARARRSLIWLSRDGMKWHRHELPAILTAAAATINGTAGGFLARTRDDRFFYWSVDGVDWPRIERPWVPRPGTKNRVIPSQDGVTFTIQRPADSAVDLWHTKDGSTWDSSTIEYSEATGPADFAPFGVARGDQGWIVVGAALETTLVGRRPVTHVWVSADGAAWTFAGAPNFTTEGGRVASVVVIEDLVLVPTTASTRPGELVTHWWASRDGVTWIDAGEPASVFEGPRSRKGVSTMRALAGRKLDDGTYLIAYIPP